MRAAVRSVGEVIATPVVNCTGATGERPPELYAVMSLCSTPCMLDAQSIICCFVPGEVSWMFPCCRQLNCCPDQLGGESRPGHRRRKLGQLAQRDSQPARRALPTVSVSVSVEESSSSKSEYESLMMCLSRKSPVGKLACHHGDPRLIELLHTTALGRRQLQPQVLRVISPTCKNKGVNVTCDDGVKNGNESMVDCGRGCSNNQTTICAVDAAKVVARLTYGGFAPAGRFEVILPSNITLALWTGAATVAVRAAQTLMITCVAEGNDLCGWPTRFTLHSTAKLDMRGTMMHGHAMFLSGGDGGAIATNGNTQLNIERVRFVRFRVNQLGDGNGGGSGGAIYAGGGAGTIASTSFVDNSAANAGAAIYTSGGTLNISMSIYSNNTAAGNGGAIFADGGTITISRSRFAHNSAATAYGGAITAGLGTLTITSTQFTSNTANAGGAIFAGGGILEISFSSFTNNTGGTAAPGGGLFAYNTVSVTLLAVTFIGNKPDGFHCGNPGKNLVSSTTTSTAPFTKTCDT